MSRFVTVSPAKQKQFNERIATKIEEYLRASEEIICIIKISEKQLKNFKILGSNIGIYPQLLIGMPSSVAVVLLCFRVIYRDL